MGASVAKQGLTLLSVVRDDQRPGLDGSGCPKAINCKRSMAKVYANTSGLSTYCCDMSGETTFW